MTILQPAVTGDIGDRRVLLLGGLADRDAIASVVTHIWPHGGASVALDAEVLNAEDTAAHLAAKGLPANPDAVAIAIELGDDDGWLATVDFDRDQQTFSCEHQVTFLNGNVITWPTIDQITVRKQRDPTP